MINDCAEGYSAEDYLNGGPIPKYLHALGPKLKIIELEDIGLVGSDRNPLSSSIDYSEDSSSRERVALGLPLSFTSSKKSHHQQKKPRNKASPGVSVDPAKVRTTMRRPGLNYWLQRYCLFSRFDEGIQMDAEGWYSTTPESIAVHQAQRVLRRGSRQIILDAFCGVGGNTVQFARTGDFVLAVEIDRCRLEAAKNNCRVYGVDKQVEFLHGDFFQFKFHFSPDVVFLSPPWGGPTYLQQRRLHLSDTVELCQHLTKALEVCKSLFDQTVEETGRVRVVMYLPRNIDLVSLLKLDLFGFQILEIEIMKINSLVKALTVYMS